jgi:hypothetical protein
MTTHTFTLTVASSLTSDRIHDLLDEIITDGQSVARQAADDEEATERTRQLGEEAAALDITITPATTHTVVVGNVGTVYHGPDEAAADHNYRRWTSASASGSGRAAGEPVTWFKGGEIEKEYLP